MAIQTHIQPARARFAGLPSAGDRAKAFRAAKRHSFMVGALRWFLPLAAVSIAGLYFLPSKIAIKVGDGEASIQKIDLSGDGLKMINPRFKGVNEKQGVYDFQADYATQQVANPDIITLNVVNAEITTKEGQKTTLKAPTGIFERKKEELTFNNGVVIGGNAGFSGTLKTAVAFMQNHTVISKDPVDLAFRQNTVKADGVTLYSNESRAIFEGHVKVHLERNQEASRP
jgi:lipopolysaccharide export system protein LptC